MSKAYWDEIESGVTPAYWDDGKTIHACEGAKIFASADIFLMWTKCRRDVPAGQAYVVDGETVTCPKCLASIECPCDAETTVDPHCAALGECAKVT